MSDAIMIAAPRASLVTKGTQPAVVVQGEPGVTPLAAYLARLGSVESRRSMLQSLNLIAGLLSKGILDAQGFPWAKMTYEASVGVRAWLMGKYAPASANRHLAALRGVLRECWRLGLMTVEQFQRASDVKAVRGERPLAGRALSKDEITKLFAAAAKGRPLQRERDGALLVLGFCAGLRRFEIAGLNLVDFDGKESKLIVRGKGAKTRFAYLPPNALSILREWLAVRGTQSGPLLLAMNRHGGLRHARMSGDGIDHILKEIGARAGVSNFSPHDLRRTAITELLDRGVDLALAQKFAGHRRPETTAAYDRRPVERRRAAVALIDVPS